MRNKRWRYGRNKRWGYRRRPRYQRYKPRTRITVLGEILYRYGFIIVWPSILLIIVGIATIGAYFEKAPGEEGYEEIIKYRIGGLGQNDAAVRESIEKAIMMWEMLNPDLDFIESESPDLLVAVHCGSRDSQYLAYAGLYSCDGTRTHSAYDSRCRVTACVPSFEVDQKILTTTFMHEFGHVLGLGHAREKDHLMYSYIDPEDPFDTKGYTIPPRLDI